MDGEGRAPAYPGGWSAYAAQRPAIEADAPKSGSRPAAAAAAKPETAAKPAGLSFPEKKRLDDLPALIERLAAEIGKLGALLEDPALFTREPVKFRKATEALTERQRALEAAESEWLDLAERA